MNRAARLIKGISPHERITPVLIDLNWLLVKVRVEYKIAIISHQALYSGKPKYIKNTLKKFYQDTVRELRHNADLHRLLNPYAPVGTIVAFTLRPVRHDRGAFQIRRVFCAGEFVYV